MQRMEIDGRTDRRTHANVWICCAVCAIGCAQHSREPRKNSDASLPDRRTNATLWILQDDRLRKQLRRERIRSYVDGNLAENEPCVRESSITKITNIQQSVRCTAFECGVGLLAFLFKKNLMNDWMIRWNLNSFRIYNYIIFYIVFMIFVDPLYYSMNHVRVLNVTHRLTQPEHPAGVVVVVVVLAYVQLLSTTECTTTECGESQPQSFYNGAFQFQYYINCAHASRSGGHTYCVLSIRAWTFFRMNRKSPCTRNAERGAGRQRRWN